MGEARSSRWEGLRVEERRAQCGKGESYFKTQSSRTTDA
jgi:hypothetical protein